MVIESFIDNQMKMISANSFQMEFHQINYVTFVFPNQLILLFQKEAHLILQSFQFFHLPLPIQTNFFKQHNLHNQSFVPMAHNTDLTLI